MAATNLATADPYDPTSVAQGVEKIASKDSALNQMASTEAAKVMNRRGMLNSSMMVGAAQDAVIKNAVPIASQDAAQAFQKQENSKQIASTEKMSLAQIASTEGMASAQRVLDEKLQKMSIDAAVQSQIKDIASREGMAAADRELQKYMQSQDITAQKSQQAADIASKEKLADWDYQLQTTLASWNLASADRNAAAQFLTNMETMYQSSYDSIMANEYLEAADREAQLTAAKQMRDVQINFVEQMYGIDLWW